MSKKKVDKIAKRRKGLKEKIVFGLLLLMSFSALLLSPSLVTEVAAMTEEEKAEANERLDELLEKTEELMILLQKKFQRGELPSSAKIPVGEPYIKEYIAYGASNSKDEVKKLQIFLNNHMGESLPVDGYYGSSSFEAVKRFQLKYASEILHPWGINEPTGFVYLTTQRKINALQYPDRYFPMPTNLIPYTRTVSYDVALEPVTDDDEVTLEEECVKEEEEEIVEKITEVVKDREETNFFFWLIIAFSFIAFSTIVSYFFIIDNKKAKKLSERWRSRKKKTDT